MKRTYNAILILLSLFVAFTTVSCEKEDEKAAKELTTLKAFIAAEFPNATEVTEGVYLVKIKEGTGSSAGVGLSAIVHYTGWLMDGTQFDTSRDDSSPFSFTVGAGYVIPAWEYTVRRMRVGDRVLMYTTSANAYGAKGAGDDIGPYATLKFEIELLGVSK